MCCRIRYTSVHLTSSKPLQLRPRRLNLKENSLSADCMSSEFSGVGQVPQKQRLTAAGSTHGSGRLRNSFRNDCRIFGGSSSPTCPGK